jgi:hypothetical protein
LFYLIHFRVFCSYRFVVAILNIRHCWVLKTQAIFLLLEPKSSMRSS